MIRYDTHMHSSFSTDSDASMESMVAGAQKAGLEGICFTEHMDLDYPRQYFPSDPNAFAADPEEVFREIRRLRGLAGHDDAGVMNNSRISIGFGLEFGMQPHLADRFHDIAQSCHLDYIVASQHLVASMDPYYPEAWEGFTPDELISRYYQEMLSNIKAMKEWDSLAHMDYIIRYTPNQSGHVYDSYERHSDVIDEILRYVISSGKCLEVNTAGYKYGLGQPNPSPAILKRYRQLGGERITVGADAHAPEHIAGGFIQAEKLLLSLGFRTYSVFKQRRMREIQFSSISS